MTTRKIKDAKDLSDDSLIYFKSHAKATYMSDGSTVEDAIKNIENNNGNIDLSDYETKLESQAKFQEAKNYTNTAIANLVDSAPETLNTLNELAVAIQDNEDVVEALNQSIGSKQDTLISGTNIKTVNGQSLLGEGDLEIQEFKTYTFDYNNYTSTITQEELNKVLEADKIYIKDNNILVEVTAKHESDESLVLRGYNTSVTIVREYNVSINKNELTCILYLDESILITDSEVEDLTTQIHYNEVICPDIEDGLVLEEQYINFDPSKIAILKVGVESNELFKIFYLYSNVSDDNSYNTSFYGKYTDTSLLKATYNVNDYTLTFNIIEQLGGNNSSGGAYALVEHGTNDTTYILTPNTFHVWGEVGNLTLTFGEEQSGVANEFLFQFESGETATTLTLPDDLIWANDDIPVIESNYTYQVSILKGLATLMKFKKVVLQEFTITVYEGYGMNTRHETYSYKTGMTWGQWVNSEYNTNGDYKITNGYIYNDVANVMSGVVYYATSLGPVEITESDLIDNTITYAIE